MQTLIEDLLIKISEEFSTIASSSNQDFMEPIYALLEEQAKTLPVHVEKGFSTFNFGKVRFYRTRFTEAIVDILHLSGKSADCIAAENYGIGL